MALFRRNNPTTDAAGDNTVPVDLQQYYSSGSSGVMRWILRIVLLLVIFALLVWGGIWLFRTLSGNDTAKEPAQGQTAQQQKQEEQKQGQTDAEKKAQAEADAKKAQEAAKAKAAQEKAAADAKKAEEEAKRKAAAGAAGGAATTQGGGTATAPAPAPAPATGGSGAGTSTAALPATGPTETIAAIFGAAAVLGTLGHMIVQRRMARQQ